MKGTVLPKEHKDIGKAASAVDDARSARPAAEAEPKTALPVYMIFHIPKCAGRTIDRHLRTHLPSGTYYHPKRRHGVSRFFQPRYQLRGMPAPHNLLAICGHCLGCSLERYFPGREIRRCVLLRDPVSRLVSYYNFRMMRYLAQGKGTYDFELAYRSAPRNSLSSFILNTILEISSVRLMTLSVRDKYEIASAFLSSCWFVGDYKRCNELIAALAPGLNIPAEAVPRNTRVEGEQRTSWRGLTVEALPCQVVERIRKDNRLDQLLWESWKDTGHSSAPFTPGKIELGSSPWLAWRGLSRAIYQLQRGAKRAWGRSVRPGGGKMP